VPHIPRFEMEVDVMVGNPYDATAVCEPGIRESRGCAARSSLVDHNLD